MEGNLGWKEKPGITEIDLRKEKNQALTVEEPNHSDDRREVIEENLNRNGDINIDEAVDPNGSDQAQNKRDPQSPEIESQKINKMMGLIRHNGGSPAAMEDNNEDQPDPTRKPTPPITVLPMTKGENSDQVIQFEEERDRIRVQGWKRRARKNIEVTGSSQIWSGKKRRGEDEGYTQEDDDDTQSNSKKIRQRNVFPGMYSNFETAGAAEQPRRTQ
ncbi:hypothetical protein U1Q18_036784 [Sarracenia purpurea var. burkii]